MWWRRRRRRWRWWQRKIFVGVGVIQRHPVGREFEVRYGNTVGPEASRKAVGMDEPD